MSEVQTKLQFDFKTAFILLQEENKKRVRGIETNASSPSYSKKGESEYAEH